MTTPQTSPPSPSASAPSQPADSVPPNGNVDATHPSLHEHAAALASALATFAQQMKGMEYGAEHLTCSEIDSIMAVLELSGFAEEAAELRDYHAHGDNEGYEQHHARWHELNDTEPDERCCLPLDTDDQINRIKEG